VWRQTSTEPAVDDHGRSSHKRCIVTGEKRGGPPNFGGQADPVKGVQHSSVFSRLDGVGLRLEVGFGQSRVDVSRTDRVHADSLSAMINRNCLSKGEDCSLGSTVSSTRWFHKKTVHGGHVDNDPARLAQVGEKSARAEEDPANIYRHLPGPLFRSGILNEFVDLNRRIIYEYRQRSKPCSNKGAQSADGLRISHVRLKGPCITSPRTKICGRLLRLGSIDIDEHDPRALVTEALCDCPANPRARPGHDCQATLQ